MDNNRNPIEFNLKENRGYVLPSEVGTLPESPGVYLMKNKEGIVIYIGKAKNLKKRVSNYFQSEKELKIRFLVINIAIIDYIKVSNESEALILEANLIKEYKPKYNVMFKDNKFYPFIKVTVRDDFPRIVFSRDERKDGSKYFGPYTSARSVRQYIDVIQRLFFIRTCVEMPKKECLNYHIKRCSGPCIHKITYEDYREQVKQALSFLSGDYGNLVSDLEAQMKSAAHDLLFEKAQLIKEKITAIRMFESTQSVFLDSNINADFIGLFTKMGKIIFVASIIRNGKMIGKRSYSATLQFEEDIDDILTNFIIEYSKQNDKNLTSIFIDGSYREIIEPLNVYFENINSGIHLNTPHNENQKALIRMATENASLHLVQILSKVETSESLKLLQDVINLDTLPMRIEGFDIANILGENAVASMVSFYAGKPDKKNYRHYKIKTKSTPDDYAMINEVVYRRYKRLKEEGEEFPDLILIDGGKGQLNAAYKALSDLGVTLNIVSLAKKNEEIYNLFQDKPLVLNKNSAALHILQQVRDESHRFANSFYNKIKGDSNLESLFEKIPGIGKKRKQIILQKFLNHDIIKNLKTEDLIKEGIPGKIAEELLLKLKSKSSEKK